MGSPAYDHFWGSALALTRIFHHAVDRLSGGRLGAHFPGGAQVVWIQTIGRKSGEWRRTALLGAPDGDTWIIAGSNAGQERIPAWVFNINANPAGRLERGKDITDVTFRELHGDERTAAYSLLVKDWKSFAMYERNAQRTIPVFRITPTLQA
jgi:deazaflavin-dependent oxidoreductase (nitroreductase family)